MTYNAIEFDIITFCTDVRSHSSVFQTFNSGDEARQNTMHQKVIIPRLAKNIGLEWA